jgi:3-phenylpropionate/trans-cinnamate dioxygenase alpha subunit
VDRRIFSDSDIYQLELERIFARSWNFMCHETQIPNPGDFFMTFIGEDRVICVRDNDGRPQVLVNSCRHRGNAVCRAEEGHATSFMCTYHGWTYDLKGALVGVPGFKEVYHEELDRENWGLIRAAQVDSYKGFIFANMDPEAPGLFEYLGDAGRMGISTLAERGDRMVALQGVVKYTIPCNWKFAVDNVWDYYHGSISHASSGMAGFNNQARRPVGQFNADHLIFLGEYGHVLGGPRMTEANKELRKPTTEQLKAGADETWRDRPQALEALGPIGTQSRGHTNVFPNFWVATDQISLRLPKGPKTTEIWWFTILPMDKADEVIQSKRYRAEHTFGPAGMLEEDDGENWGQSTRGMVGAVSDKYPLHYAMGIGHGEIIRDEQSPPRIEPGYPNEHPQLWHYRAWSEWIAAESWGELRAIHSRVPEDRV